VAPVRWRGRAGAGVTGRFKSPCSGHCVRGRVNCFQAGALLVCGDGVEVISGFDALG